MARYVARRLMLLVPAWLIMGALAFYGLWKNYQNGRPVTLVMTDEQGRDYIRIADSDLGPELATAAP